MKNNLSKYYITAIYFGSTFMMFADPGTEDEAGTLENTDPAPINDYLWVLFALGMLLVFLKFRAMQKQGVVQE